MASPASSTTSTCSSSQSRALRRRMSVRMADTWSYSSNCWRTTDGSSCRCSPTWTNSASRSSSVASMLSASATARRARSNLAPRNDVARSSSTNSSDCWPELASHWSRVRPWACRRMAKSCRRCDISFEISGSGTSTSTSSASASLTFSRSDIWACILRTAVMRSARSSRSSAMVSNSDASAAHASSGSGSTRSLTSLRETTKCRPSSSGSGCSASKDSSSPADAPTRASSSSGTMPPEPTSYE